MAREGYIRNRGDRRWQQVWPTSSGEPMTNTSAESAPEQVQYEGGQQALVLDRWMRATREALRPGTSEEDLHTMLQTAADNLLRGDVHHGDAPPHTPDTVYDELPPGLIDLRSAVAKYSINRNTLQTWIQNGRLQTFGRLKAPAAGGGYRLLSEAELVDYLVEPRSTGGRPRKKP